MLKRNKYILVTGSSSGIGKQTALDLLKKKFFVIGISRNRPNIKNSKYLHLSLDLSDRASDKKILKSLKNKKVKLDGIVNNAGINLPNKFDKISLEDYNRVLKTNLEAPFFLTQKLIPIIKRGATLINISSFSSISGGPYSSHYAISKSGIETLTKNLAIFFRSKKIRVNAISPGLINTNMASNFKDHPYFNRILLNRVGTTAEISNVIQFLLSEGSSYINGQVLNVDGGMFLR